MSTCAERGAPTESLHVNDEQGGGALHVCPSREERAYYVRARIAGLFVQLERSDSDCYNFGDERVHNSSTVRGFAAKDVLGLCFLSLSRSSPDRACWVSFCGMGRIIIHTIMSWTSSWLSMITSLARGLTKAKGNAYVLDLLEADKGLNAAKVIGSFGRWWNDEAVAVVIGVHRGGCVLAVGREGSFGGYDHHRRPMHSLV
ncbi:hypothetical protein L7F22_053749 [Adiantum nelumboides]|nr:hypothetical protein [Adiantum nelumboides]